ncbi:MAG: phytanoyl-CoA dioxygenase family protein [Candidatus Handelsmanbacteria bacterium]|nr:phytanoyl-CoA dioxygenase family protein [Candidatus Handelsmanbacteria bacterium]
MRNVITLHPVFMKIVEHPGMLPLVVDLMGFDIQLRTSHMDVRPPQPASIAEKTLGSPESFFPWHADQPDYGWPLVSGSTPFMEMKISYYLTYLTQRHSGAICVVRGSHHTPPWLGGDQNNGADLERMAEVIVRPGTALVWHTAMWDCVTSNLSGDARKCLYYGYHPRWIRLADFEHQEPQVVAGCTPIQLHLLGELGTGRRNYAGDDTAQPVSRHWRPKDEDIPLKGWAEAQRHR